MIRHWILSALLISAAGCSSHPAKLTTRCEFIAARTAVPVVVDGLLSEAVWEQSPTIRMQFSNADATAKGTVQESGSIQFAWDDQNIYLAARLEDSDIVAEGMEDQMPHFKMGDVLEWFLKPENETWYWELYVTPHSRKSSLWFPGRGRLGLPSAMAYSCGLNVAAKMDGTLNDWADTDRGWTAEMSIPWKDLCAHGEPGGAGTAWKVLVGRYNYSRYLDAVEVTMAPQLSITNYHTINEYVHLQFVEN